MRRRSEAAVPRLGARAEPPLPLARPAGLAGVSPDSHLPLEWFFLRAIPRSKSGWNSRSP